MRKNLNFLAFVFTAILITIAGCEKDKEKPLDELILGKWEKQSAYYAFYENNVKTGEQGDTFDPNEYVYEVLKGGTGNIYEDGTITQTFTWTLVGTSLTIENPNELTEGDISIENNILTLEGTETSTSNGILYENYKVITFKKV